MAKTRTPNSGMAPAPEPSESQAEGKLIAYAETLGAAMGQLRNHVDSWNGQRQQLTERLASLVNDAQALLADLGHNAADSVTRLRGRRRPKKAAKPQANPAGALKPAKRAKGLTEARRAAMSAELKPRPTRYPSARAANR